MKAGAIINTDGSCLFSVWAPQKERVTLHIVSPRDTEIPMVRDEEGYFSVRVEDIHEGCRYFFNPDGEGDLPDPASAFQPDGVHGPSQVVDHSGYEWHDKSWRGLPLRDLIFYELHTGTFTPEGTFEAIIPRLDELADTGINAIELMPVAQFPGNRNWGYDGVFPYSVQNSYGSPDGLKKFVDAAHAKDMAVFLDVVYNHIGPEGNYLGKFAPYFTDRYKVPWGDAINYDEAWSDPVRDFFSCNACNWLENYHIDGLRIDAIHMIYDFSAVHFLEMLHYSVKHLEQLYGKRFYLIAESDLNSPKVVKSPEAGGFGFDAQWLDDFHHALYVLLYPEGRDRYEDFNTLEQLGKAYLSGFVHSGEYVKFRKKRHGASSAGIPGEKFVVFNQNHDQVGNRVMGERLCMLTGFDQVKMAAAAIILSPYIPLLFMGEEYGDENPFFYFVSHSDSELVKAVREGRKNEFRDYKWKNDPPDAQDESTFLKSKISWEKRYSGKHKILLEWTKELIRLRKKRSSLRNTSKNGIFVYTTGEKLFAFTRTSEDGREILLCILNFSNESMSFTIPSVSGSWQKILNSSDPAWSIDDDSRSAIPDRIKSGQLLTVGPLSVVVFGNA
ncbi:MAG TPA: malto-oligosyltrehalose trehalohydrolase [Bacteroidales bacterium]|nr:malto-oligosyltrehalose trehalohydrolase [Bacteroidales bacterium]